MQGLFARPEVKQRRLGQTVGTQVEVDPGGRAMAQVNYIDLGQSYPTLGQLRPGSISILTWATRTPCVSALRPPVSMCTTGSSVPQKKKTASQFALPPSLVSGALLSGCEAHRTVQLWLCYEITPFRPY